MFLLKYLQLTSSRQCARRANMDSLSAPPTASITEHTEGVLSAPRHTHPVAGIIDNGFTKQLLCAGTAPVSFSSPNTRGRAGAASSFLRGSSRGLER